MQNSKLLYLILTARSILIVRTYWSVSPKITGKLEREGETQKAKQITKLHSASGKQLESWFSKNLSEVQSCEITLCLLTPTPVACPARISLYREFLVLISPAVPGCWMLLWLKTSFDTSFSFLFSGCALLSFLEWVPFVPPFSPLVLFFSFLP